MSLPAAARRRWRIEDGGELGWLDVGSALVLLPGGIDAVRNDLGDLARARRSSPPLDPVPSVIMDGPAGLDGSVRGYDHRRAVQ